VTPIRRYLLDTTALIDISKEIEPISSHIRGWLAGPNEVGVCGVVAAEFFAGLRPEERPPWVSFVDRLTFWIVTRRIAIQAGIYRHDHARLGMTLSTSDTLIAAVAVSVGATVVTRNIKDFPMTGLSVMQVDS
jgi:predicted nucleic acid-binding protein